MLPLSWLPSCSPSADAAKAPTNPNRKLRLRSSKNFKTASTSSKPKRPSATPKPPPHAVAERANAANANAGNAETRERREREREQVAASPDAGVDPSSSDGGIMVPDVVGLDHQAAQNALQGEGLYSLDERDCSGQGRLLLFDRNWEVVSTEPPAGTPVSENTTITLCSVKQGEQ